MTVRFLHSADWQIGKVYRFVDEETMAVLQDARLNAIDRLGAIAVERDLPFVLVAGDVYDAENLSTKSQNQPLERMRKYPSVQWYLLPGNHDPHRPNGLWDRIRKKLPENVHICNQAEPIFIESEKVAILPAPLRYKSTLNDPTDYMDSAESPEQYVRIGLAHGSITDFGSGESKNYVNPNRPQSAGLAYLAMGDWHGTRQINPRCWYSGTPEIDRFNLADGGNALVVAASTGTSHPKVEPVRTGEFQWLTVDERIDGLEDIESLQEKLSSLGQHLDRILVRLNVEGTVTLDENSRFDEQISERFNASFRYFFVDDEHLYSRMTDDDLNRIDTGGFVRNAADRLKYLAENSEGEERKLASLALKRLYVELVKLEAKEA